jgi:hypothetical protein
MVVFAMVGTTAVAKPPLREVAEIDDMVMKVAIADEIRKSCDGINARLLTAYFTLNGLKSLAREKGYSDEEIEHYVTSKSEKERMRLKAEAYLAQNGVQANDRAALCRFGKIQIQTQTEIGQLLK